MRTTCNVDRLSLVKGSHRYLVRCRPGSEEATISQLMAWAEDDRLDFDWFDAAVLARQITRRQFERTVGQSENA